VGMGDSRTGSSKDSPLTEHEINARYLLDMVYSPPETRLAKLARAKGVEVIPGTEMFVHQAAHQFEIWTGKPAPAVEMQHVLQKATEAALSSGNGTRRHSGYSTPRAGTSS